MPFKWSEIFAKENTIVKARADRAINDKTDPHVLLQVSIRQLEEDHDKLEQACAVVIGQFNLAQEKLEADLEAERQLESQGRAAAQAGHLDAARAIAHRLDAVRGRLVAEQRMFDAGKLRAEEAKSTFAENGELLRQKMDEAAVLDAEIDQAAMEHNMNEAMKSVTSMTSRSTPSFDQVRDRVHSQHAQETAHAELAGTDPNVSAIHEQHLVHEAGADDILAAWTQGSAVAPAPERKAITPPPTASKDPDRPTKAAAPKGQSAADRLNS
jgi:phage shock protein A